MATKVRDATIDNLKALSILGVIVAHYCGGFFSFPEPAATIAHTVQNVISGFVLPLFLFFSGWFHRDAPWGPFLAKSARALLVPFVVTLLGAVALLLACGHPDLAVHKLWGVLVVNGSEVGDQSVRWLRWAGPIWFLPVLFWCRVIHKALYGRLPGYLAVMAILPWLTLTAGHWIPNYTFGLLLGVSCCIYYSLGAWCREHRMTERLPAFFASGLWAPALLLCVYSMPRHCLDFSTFNFEPYPVTLLAALFSIVFLYRALSHVPRLFRPALDWVGSRTLLILCYHTLAFVIVPEIYRRWPSLKTPVCICSLNAAITFSLTIVHVAARKALFHAA